MTRNFEIWNHNQFEMDGFALLVEKRDIIRGVYNNEPAIVTGLSKQEILDMYNAQDPNDKIEYLQEWAKEENIGETPDYIFSDENQTIILNGEIYETYADLIADIYEDHAYARIDGKIVWRDEDYETVKLIDEAIMLTQANQNIYPWAGKTTDGKILVMIYSNWEHSSDIGKVFEMHEFNQYCIDNDYDNPFAKSAKDDRLIPIVEYAAMHGKAESSARRKAIRGGFTTAKKIGRNWVIDKSEPYTDLRKCNKKLKKKTKESH